MRSDTLLHVGRTTDHRTTIRDLRSETPIRLIPRRPAVPSHDGSITVRIVAAAAAPLGGDHLTLHVHVGTGAHLRLIGTGATLVLPGPAGDPSSSTVHVAIDAGGTLEYLPDETIVCTGADHHTALHVNLATDATLRYRETLILGRHNETPGRLTTTTHVTRADMPLLRQTLDLTNHRLLGSPSYLTGATVLATELLIGDEDPPTAATGPLWALTPLHAGGTLATALAHDHTTAINRLTTALRNHPTTPAGEV